MGFLLFDIWNTLRDSSDGGGRKKSSLLYFYSPFLPAGSQRYFKVSLVLGKKEQRTIRVNLQEQDVDDPCGALPAQDIPWFSHWSLDVELPLPFSPKHPPLISFFLKEVGITSRSRDSVRYDSARLHTSWNPIQHGKINEENCLLQQFLK